MKTDKATVRDPRADWLQALTACEQQIVNMASVLRQVVIATGTDGYSGGLYEEVDTLHLRLGQLVQEIEQQEWPALTDSPMQITIGEVLAMNRLREKVRKMEQSVFLLRYKVNQFFSNCQAA